MCSVVLLTVCAGKQFSVSSLTLREKKSESHEGMTPEVELASTLKQH